MAGMLDNVYVCVRASQVALVVKDSPASVGDVRDTGSIPGLGRSPGGRHGNPLQYSCLENPMDRDAWRATVHGVKKSWTRLKQLSVHTHTHECVNLRKRIITCLLGSYLN